MAAAAVVVQLIKGQRPTARVFVRTVHPAMVVLVVLVQGWQTLRQQLVVVAQGQAQPQRVMVVMAVLLEQQGRTALLPITPAVK